MKNALLIFFFLFSIVSFSSSNHKEKLSTQADAGPDRVICSDCNGIQIGTPGNPDYCYNWSPKEGLSDPNSAMPIANPQTTNTYLLTVTGDNFNFKDVDAVTITVINRNEFSIDNVTIERVAPPDDVFENDCTWGMTGIDDFIVYFDVCLCNENWRPVITDIDGYFYEASRLLDGVEQVIIGPDGNTSISNFCSQVEQLKAHYLDTQCPISTPIGGLWYTLDAVKAHEDVHVYSLASALEDISMDLSDDVFLNVAISNSPEISNQAAYSNIYNSPLLEHELSAAYNKWLDKFLILGDQDHQSPEDNPEGTVAAELAVIAPLIEYICSYAAEKDWPYCEFCDLN